MAIRAVRSFEGMVGAGNQLAAAEGLAVLKAGGNAIDAAIAAATVLAVVSPHECGLGGDLFALIYDARTGAVSALNASGFAAAAATPERFTAMPETGPQSICVPGMVAGWAAALERFGTRTLGASLAAAIGYARDGFPVYDLLIQNTEERRASITADPTAGATFLPGGKPLVEGTRFRQPALARTLATIARDGVRSFYDGAIAKSMASELSARGGILAIEDFAAFQPLWPTPLATTFRGHRVLAVPPNSWGVGALLQLHVLERDGGIDAPDTASALIASIRARRTAYKLLAGTVGDPDHVGDRAARILAEYAASMTPAAGSGAESRGGTDTSNIVAVDRAGNAISILQSVFAPFGSGVLAADTGVLFNNRMRGFALAAGDANRIGPRKRPAQTLTPMLVTRDGRASHIVNSPGGPGQTGTMAQMLVRLLAHREPLAQAIAAPRWAMTWKGDLILEDALPAEVQAKVLAAEPAVTVAPYGALNFGSVLAIQRDRDGGDGWIGAADDRRNAAMLAL